MEKKHNETVLPISWDGWDQVDTNVLQFYNVEFTDNFGVFTNGESISCIIVNFQKGIIESYLGDSGDVDKTQEFICTPKQ